MNQKKQGTHTHIEIKEGVNLVEVNNILPVAVILKWFYFSFAWFGCCL